VGVIRPVTSPVTRGVDVPEPLIGHSGAMVVAPVQPEAKRSSNSLAMASAMMSVSSCSLAPRSTALTAFSMSKP